MEARLLKKIRIMRLETQQIRESLVIHLLDLLKIAREELEQTLDTKKKANLSKIVSYISTVTNQIMNSYDEVRFNEELEKLERMIEEAKAIKEKLERGEGRG